MLSLEEDTGSPGAGVTDSYELPDISAEKETLVLGEGGTHSNH